VSMVAASKTRWEAEVGEVRRLAGALGCDDPEAWDIPYYSENLRERDYALNREQLRPYFPANRVIEGLFAITGQLFGIRFEPREAVDLWHPDARCYSVLRDGAPIAVCYLDLYARAKKRGGARMADYCGRRRTGGGTQLP